MRMASFGMKTGAPPESFIYTGKKEKAPPNLLQVIKRNDEKKVLFEEDMVVEDLEPSDGPEDRILFVNGLSDADQIVAIGRKFGLHPLTVEDILNVSQRSKVEFFEDYVSIHTRVFSYTEDDDGETTFTGSAVALVLSKFGLLVFQDSFDNQFEVILRNLQQGRPIYFKWGLDFMLFALVDYIVDSNLEILNRLNTSLETLEDGILENTDVSALPRLRVFRNYLIRLRRAVWPLRDAISTLRRDLHPLISPDIRLYWNDVYDHTIQVIDLIETTRDILSSVGDLYLTTQSNKMNEVMKTLTIISTIFIPLTFLTSLYGMNFVYIPELEYRNGYFVLWGVMVVIFGFQLYFFRRRKWI